MGKIVIIDDDALFSKHLKTKIEDRFEKEIVVMNNVDIAYINQIAIDIIFLDIELGEKSGFDVAKIIQKKEENPILVFISNYDNYLHPALTIQPFYFIRKMHLTEDLAVLYFLLRKHRYDVRDNIIFGGQVLNLKDVMVFSPDGKNYVKADIVGDGYIWEKTSLKKLEIMLESKLFIRISLSYLINWRYIVECNNQEVVLSNGKSYRIGRKYQKQTVKKYIEWKLGNLI